MTSKLLREKERVGKQLRACKVERTAEKGRENGGKWEENAIRLMSKCWEQKQGWGNGKKLGTWWRRAVKGPAKGG